MGTSVRSRLLQISVATRCTADWKSMTGNAAVRHCGECRKNVYNLSAMSDARVADLLASAEDHCIRYYHRPDGTVVRANCADGTYRAPQRLAFGMAAALSGVVAAVPAAAEIAEPATAADVEVAMGLGMKFVVKPKAKPKAEQPVADVEPELVPAASEPAEVQPVADVKPALVPAATEPAEVQPAPAGPDGWAIVWSALAGVLAFFAVLGFGRRRARLLSALDAWSVPQLAAAGLPIVAAAAATTALTVLAAIGAGIALGLAALAQRAR